MELRAEDLGEDPAGVLASALGPHGLETAWEGMPVITADRVNYWEDEMPAAMRKEIEHILGDVVEALGY